MSDLLVRYPRAEYYRPVLRVPDESHRDPADRTGMVIIGVTILTVVADLVTIGVLPTVRRSPLNWILLAVVVSQGIVVASQIRSRRELYESHQKLRESYQELQESHRIIHEKSIVLEEKSQTFERKLQIRERSLSRLAPIAWEYKRKDPLYYTIEKWDEVLTISEGGDTQIELFVSITAGDEPVELVRTIRNQTVGVEFPDQVRDRVRARVLAVDEDGEDGARFDSTVNWDGPYLRLFTHLDPPLPPQQSQQFRIVITWPEYMKAFLAGKAEVVEWKFWNTIVDFTSKVVILRECGVASRIRVSPFGGVGQPKQRVLHSGDRTLEIHGTFPKVGTDFGYKIDRSDIDS
ncbi:MAG: hypothetical protein FWD55_06990 [Propionibacteriaceae bacterium]|nr:hypothetical protein [Propionibacteriaceae bacterium]